MSGAAGASGGAAGYVAGIVHYRDYEALDRCLRSLKAQALAPSAVLVVDVEPEAARHEALRRRHSDATWRTEPNRGFAAAANLLVREAGKVAPDAEYFLLLNADVEVEPGFAERLIEAVAPRSDVALASGKLFRPDGRTLDSTGIVLPLHRRPRDRGSEEPDRGRYDREEEVFGVTGAAMWIRRAALPDLALAGEIFDEDFFLYHEDTDLCWRARRLGWRALYVPSARALHERGWRRDGRYRVPARVRRHAFKNHYLELLKNETLAGFLRSLPFLLPWELARLGYALLRDREVLGAYGEAARLAPRAWRKRRELAARLAARPAPSRSRR